MTAAVPNEVLAERARAEAQQHAPRTPERRAAAHLWTSLITSPTVSAARNAIATFGTAETQAAALELLARLAPTLSEPEGSSA
jgi:hypothetical protein